MKRLALVAAVLMVAACSTEKPPAKDTTTPAMAPAPAPAAAPADTGMKMDTTKKDTTKMGGMKMDSTKAMTKTTTKTETKGAKKP